MCYYYYYWYNPQKDNFYGKVYQYERTSPVFSIEKTSDIIELIKQNKMTHIDDIKGLENHLKSINILGKDDTLTFSYQF